MSVGVLQTTKATSQYSEHNAGKKPANDNIMDPDTSNDLILLSAANTPDQFIESIAKQEAVENFNKKPTRTATSVVGHSIPFVDSFLKGASHNGPASAKVGKTVSTGSDWGVFTGAVWLYNKALDKVYDNVPGLRKFKEDHPATAFVGEVASGVAVGQTAIWGYHKGTEKLTGKTSEVWINQATEKMKNSSETIAKVFKPFEKIPSSVKRWGGFGLIATLGGLIIKNIYDVHKIKTDTDERAEQLKAVRNDAAERAANIYAS